MNTKTEKRIKDFKDLITWKESHKLVLDIYRVTKIFPKDEIFGLISQMRRASVSITSNIAEGFGRQGIKEKVQFFYLSQGSLIELKNQIEISKDISYINENDYKKLIEQANLSHKLLQGLITKTKSFLNHKF
ncbi:MAG: four helix bundle protein [Candidatus Pacebacteria bacterium]|nr:four helix bundle protein [Candidatus Paceibacterota bacterium]